MLERLGKWLHEDDRETAIFFLFIAAAICVLALVFVGFAVIIGMEIAGTDVLNSCDSCCEELT